MLSLTPPPSAPQRGDRTTFASRVDAFITWLIGFVAQLTALIAGLGTLVSGGANKIPYKIDLGTTMGDPTAGWLRLNSATQNAATAMVVDLIGSDTIDYTNLLATFSASTSTVLGQIRIEKVGDVSSFLIFSLTAITTPTGYRQFTVACIGYSSANPFAQGDPVVLSFTRTGDKGNPGNTGFAKFADQKPSGTAAGSSVSGVQTRILNTTVANTFGATLSGNTFTLPAGNYVIQVRAPALNCGAHRAALYNVTDGTTQEYGSSSFSGTASGAQTDSIVWAYVSISASKTFDVLHTIQTASSGSGLGTIGASNGGPEVYTEVSVWKLS